MSRIGLPNSSVCFSCQATMPGTRCFVRGETYRPSSSKPPWQRTPPAISGSVMSASASSSCSENSTCSVVMDVTPHGLAVGRSVYRCVYTGQLDGRSGGRLRAGRRALLGRRLLGRTPAGHLLRRRLPRRRRLALLGRLDRRLQRGEEVDDLGLLLRLLGQHDLLALRL